MTIINQSFSCCPRCGSIYEYRRYLSGNNFGATLWSDMKSYGPMTPHRGDFISCVECQECFWLDDHVCGESVYQLRQGGFRVDSIHSSYAAMADLEQAESFLSNRPLEVVDEINLRVYFWWEFNDRFRHHPPLANGEWLVPKAMIDNLRKLMNLLVLPDHFANSFAVRAEIHRQLCEFEEALTIIDGVKVDELAWWVNSMRPLCEQRICALRPLSM